MERPSNLKVGDKFVVGLSLDGTRHHTFNTGEVLTLTEDDGTSCPEFTNGSEECYVAFERLTPYGQVAELNPLEYVSQLRQFSEWHVDTSGLTKEQFIAFWQALKDDGFDVTPHQHELVNRGFVKYCRSLNYIWSSDINGPGQEVEYGELCAKPATEHSVMLTLEDCYELVEADHRLVGAQAELDNAKEVVENLLHELNALKAKHNIQ